MHLGLFDFCVWLVGIFFLFKAGEEHVEMSDSDKQQKGFLDVVHTNVEVFLCFI